LAGYILGVTGSWTLLLQVSGGDTVFDLAFALGRSPSLQNSFDYFSFAATLLMFRAS